MGTVQTHALWSDYADCYDPVIADFSENRKLVKKVVDKIGDSPLNCLDIGAGTGSTTLELLNRNPARRVHAIEPNGEMVKRLHGKLSSMDGCMDRVKISYVDCLSALEKEPAETYDACAMMNVLFALENPVECLKGIRRALKFDGILSLSTSTSDTKIHDLFEAIRHELEANGKWETLQPQFEQAYSRNREMEGMIVRYSENEIRSLLQQAGFDIQVWEPKQYVRCVVVVRAVKQLQEYEKGPG